ncbi:uncharacterized protein LOC131936403 isoform X1 [Physella acuta]|uniref:uncharacterized protein LOC131936403 isoform X1 n=1 Tax=Physella acuta TaxID=109671 RepID=UPI0027DE0DE5|nr:uncharacterized protein LOC131936403 isoform X1 [Physella acuta]
MLEAIKCRWSFYIFLVISFAVLHGEPSRDPPANGRKEELKKLLFGCADDLNFGRDLSRVASRCLAKLRQGLEEQAGLYEDSNEHWSIRAYRAYLHDNDRMYFRSLSYFSERSKQRKCHVTQVELLVPVVQSPKVKENWISIQVDGKTLNSSRGTVQMKGAAFFNLTNLQQTVQLRGFNVTVESSASVIPRPRQALLITYCNIDVTVLTKLNYHTQLQTSKPKRKRIRLSNCRANFTTSGACTRDLVRQNIRLKPKSASKNNQEQLSKQNHKKHKLKLMVLRLLNKKFPKRSAKGEENVCTNKLVDDGGFVPKLCACQRTRQVVNIKLDFGQDILLSPARADIGGCSGTCVHVSDYNQVTENKTAHAVLLNKYTSKNLHHHVTCSPNKMSSLVIMYRTEHVVYIDAIPNAIVKTCRCV